MLFVNVALGFVHMKVVDRNEQKTSFHINYTWYRAVIV